MKNSKKIVRTVMGAALAGSAVMGTNSALACGPDPYIGMVCMTAATFCPRGYAEANGTIMPIAQYTTLFAVLGTTYGGDGVTSFALPNLQGRTAVGWGRGAGLSPVQQGQIRGRESATLGVENLPSHNHTAHAVNATGTGVAADNSWPANPATSERTPVVYNGYATSGTEVTLNSGVVGSTGSNVPVSTVPPQLGMRFCIATEGVFPPRN